MGKVMTEPIDFKAGKSGTRDTESGAFQTRLLNLHEAARYIGVSYWTMREYVLDGIVPRVSLPSSRRRKKGGVVVRRAGDIGARRIYVDRTDLDDLIEQSKQHSLYRLT
jgi:predicted site-specific integrase-resolvase